MSVRGEVDAASAPQLGAAVDRELVGGGRLVLDLAGVEFMDLHGLAVLLRAARADGRRFAIARPSRCVRRLIELVHAERELRILPDGSEPLDVA